MTTIKERLTAIETKMVLIERLLYIVLLGIVAEFIPEVLPFLVALG